MSLSRGPLRFALVLVPLAVVLVLLQVRWLAELESAQGAALQRLLQQGLERMAAELDRALAEGPPARGAAPAEEELAHLARERLPELARQAFGERALATWAFALEERGGARALFDTRAGSAHAPRPADASAAVFQPVGSWTARFEPAHAGATDVGTARLESEMARSAPTSGVPGLELPLVSPARWQLAARSLDGSLAAHVARAHRRNLYLGALVLALLGAGVVLFLIAEGRARRLAQERLAFVAGVSHELRTPLAVLQSAAANLADGIVQERSGVAQYGAMIEGEVQRIANLVERVLSFSRGGGEGPLARAPVPVEELVQDALRRCEHLRARRRCALESEIAPGLPPLWCERAATTAALENLIENAIRYGPEGQTVRVHATRANGSELALEVEDQGPGVPAGERARIFEPFQRGSAARRSGSTGSGLGLDVVARVAARHGGQVLVAEAARGARFVLRLPFAGPPTAGATREAGA